jgi:hypothetical protein
MTNFFILPVARLRVPPLSCATGSQINIKKPHPVSYCSPLKIGHLSYLDR